MDLELTSRQYDEVARNCRKVFARKLVDYGASWRILRPTSLTDQIFIKAKRIRSIETTGENRVGDDIYGELGAIVNYGLIGLIQLSEGYADVIDMNVEQALEKYDTFFSAAKSLMMDKNHDYGEAWREMRTASYTDLILTKLCRVKQIEDNDGVTLVSEGIDSNYYDIINYAMFGLIRHLESTKTE